MNQQSISHQVSVQIKSIQPNNLIIKHLTGGGITKLLYFAIAMLLPILSKAQGFEVQLNPSMYAGGYNISCHGSNNGAINAYVIGGTAPFTFVWNTGATTKNLSNLTAGYYQVTVTSSTGATASAEIILIQPDAFYADLTPTEREGGYHISEFGGQDGIIEAVISGGVPPYTFLWSSGQTSQGLDNVPAGTYTLTVHDATNCASTATVTLIEPTLLHLVSISSPKVVGNYNISCAQHGSINVVVAGGSPPYEYEWNHGAFTQQADALEDAGQYTVHVTDANRVEITASITLTKAPNLTATATPFVYSNSKNTSCNSCTNGSINLSMNSGTAPYSFAWTNGSTQQNPNNLAAGFYGVSITDAAGCNIEKTVMISAPDREDWTMGGNTGTNPNVNFLGTSDNKDFVFKRNGTETMRLDTSGVKFEKLITAKSGIALNASQTFKITYDSTAGNKTIQFGRVRSNLPTCITPPTTSGIDPKYIFDGSIFFRPANPVGSTNASLAIGSAAWNGSGVIEVEGTDQNGGTSNGLMINYFCGRDVAICTNPAAGGFVSTGNNFEVGYPWPAKQSGIAANIRGSSKTGLRVETLPAAGNVDPAYNTQLSVRSTDTKIIGGFLFNNSGYDQDVFSIKGNGETNFGNGTYSALFIKPYINSSYQYQQANVGIGTTNPQEKLHIEGDVRISGLGNGSPLNLVQADADGKLSKVTSSGVIGLGLWETSNGADIYRSTGKVGIGTTSPQALLNSNGDANGINSLINVFSDNHLLITAGNTIAPNPFKEVLALKGDGELRIGCDGTSSPWQPTLYISPSTHDGAYINDQRIGVGTSTPNSQFQVGNSVGSMSLGSFLVDHNLLPNAPYTTNYIGFNAARNANSSSQNQWTINGSPANEYNMANGASLVAGSLGGDLRFITIPPKSGDEKSIIHVSDDDILQNVKMIITSNGRVGIGTSNTAVFDPQEDYRLYVRHGIKTEKIKVEVAANAGWADYVFDKNYTRMTLTDLENFIAQNKHLPNIPSECEAKANGVDLLDMQVRLLKTVEELTLHLIDLKNENEIMKATINSLQK